VRRLTLLLLAALAGTAVLAASSTAGPKAGFDLTEAGGAKFPVRSFVIGLPTTRPLTAADVQVTENGNPAVDITVKPAAAARKATFGAVLVVDASDSMEGAPLRSAMEAAQAFARRRNPNQQLAFVTFNGSTQVVLPFTTSKSKIDAALAPLPKLAYGTHIFDAVARAETMLKAAHIDSGSIVVLSDGADTGSKASGAKVTKAARFEHVKLFAVGLHSKRFNPSTLQTLARDGGGEYTFAQTSRDLAPLFDQLGSRLANEYIVQYKSLAGPKVPVRVSVSVAGAGTAAAAYRTPALPVSAAPAPYKPSISRRFWTSPFVMIVLALLGAGVVALLAIGLLAPRGTGVPARMSEFVSIPGLQSKITRPATATGATDPTIPKARKGMIARLAETLEIAQIKASPASLIAWTIIGTAVLTLLVDLATGSKLWALLALVLTPIIVREFVKRKLARRRSQFAEQLPDTLQVISSALRSGHSLAGALAVVVESSAEPMKMEMQRVVADEQLGVPLEDSLMAVAERMESRDLEQVALVAELQREAGTSSAEVVDRVAETVRDRFELRRLVATLTAQGRMSRWIVSGIPVALLLLLHLVNPHYLDPLTTTLAGKIMLGIATALVVGGSLVIKRIVNIKV
jgi:tight adherence protein B